MFPDRLNRMSAALLNRLMPRRMAIAVLERSLAGLYPRFCNQIGGAD